LAQDEFNLEREIGVFLRNESDLEKLK
jgi:hypothetical protein